MNRKNLPVILMLIAGVIASIMTFVKGSPIQEKLLIILFSLIVFYGLGCLMEGMLNYFDKKNEQKRLDKEKQEKEEASETEDMNNEKK